MALAHRQLPLKFADISARRAQSKAPRFDPRRHSYLKVQAG
jgi:hypothetical protein